MPSFRGARFQEADLAHIRGSASRGETRRSPSSGLDVEAEGDFLLGKRMGRGDRANIITAEALVGEWEGGTTEMVTGRMLIRQRLA